MTTIAVVKKNGRIAIASDRLTTFGDTRLTSKYEANPKIFKVRDTLIGIAGSSAHHNVVENALARLDKPVFGGKAEIFQTMVRLHPLLKEHFFLNPKEEDDDPYESSQMTVMIANPAGIYAVYSMREVFEFDRFWAIGSGRDFALGAMYSVYGNGRSATAIAEAGVFAGAEFDTGTALPVHLHQVTLK